MAWTIKLNEIAYTELILSVDVEASYGKVAFNISKGCKSKDNPDGNALTAWERLKNNFDPFYGQIRQAVYRFISNERLRS
jgi:hypothetical protein